MSYLLDILVVLVLIVGIRLFRGPGTARWGNWTAVVALVAACVIGLVRDPVQAPLLVLGMLLVGSALGWAVAMRVNMIQIPAMVAFQHGAGGVAAFLIAFVELSRTTITLDATGKVSGLLSLVVGAATFAGSLLAAGKLANKISGRPTLLRAHNAILVGIVAVLVLMSVAAVGPDHAPAPWLVAMILLSIVLGVVFAMRIGGADMPVLISFLNATAGLAAALCGVVLKNRLLIVFGATVAASGSILTYIMCKAMNRSLFEVLIGRAKRIVKTEATTLAAPAVSELVQAPAVTTASTDTPAPMVRSPVDQAVQALRDASSVIVIPGYGMALAQAQFAVVQLSRKLEEAGKTVRFAIHPVAGRMPGHMNVLLAEADLSYEKLVEMDAINDAFKDTDVALIVGACDVVNPAAIHAENTPISGMPILLAHEAKHVIVCNLDARPGYSGVENPLYADPKTLALFQDARGTIETLISELSAAPKSADALAVAPAAPCGDPIDVAAETLRDASSVIVIPGYGMALAQAQFAVVQLSRKLEEAGKTVRFAIHPVAGRMPGHMNVLLAEADLSYEKLVEMDAINDAFKDTDVALIVGACDVVNPAAIHAENTPISGMPILLAHEAKRVIVCNLDARPGYSGVENPLYGDPKTLTLFQDARGSIEALLARL